jgi:sugar lactone lactonase YvrE
LKSLDFRRYAVSGCVAAAMLSGCGGSQPPIGVQQEQSRTIKRSTSPCPCLYAFYPHRTLAAYAHDARGSWKQIREISGANTRLTEPKDVAEDGSGNLYVTNDGCYCRTNYFVTVYAARATGNVAPIQMIRGPATGLDGPVGIAFDQNNEQFYVANLGNNSITIYAAGANGNVAPLGVISGPNTGLSFPYGITLDTSGNIYVANVEGSITVYPAGSTGDVTPTRTIAGSRTKLVSPRELAFDSNGNIYVADLHDNPAYLTVYPAGANGNVAPLGKIHGHLTRMRRPIGVALDSSNNIYETNGRGVGINVYSAGSNGNVAPINALAISSKKGALIKMLPL